MNYTPRHRIKPTSNLHRRPHPLTNLTNRHITPRKNVRRVNPHTPNTSHRTLHTPRPVHNTNRTNRSHPQRTQVVRPPRQHKGHDAISKRTIRRHNGPSTPTRKVNRRVPKTQRIRNLYNSHRLSRITLVLNGIHSVTRPKVNRRPIQRPLSTPIGTSRHRPRTHRTTNSQPMFLGVLNTTLGRRRHTTHETR